MGLVDVRGPGSDVRAAKPAANVAVHCCRGGMRFDSGVLSVSKHNGVPGLIGNRYGFVHVAGD